MTATETRIAADDLAAQMIRTQLAAGKGVDIPGISETTALSPREVEAIRDRVASGKRDTQNLGRPRAASSPLSPPAGSGAAPPAGPAELLTAADRLGGRATVLAARIRSQLDQLRDLLEQEAEKAVLLRRKKALEDQLAAVRAELGEKVRPPKGGGARCEVCDRGFADANGLAIHNGRKHT